MMAISSAHFPRTVAAGRAARSGVCRLRELPARPRRQSRPRTRRRPASIGKSNRERAGRATIRHHPGFRRRARASRNWKRESGATRTANTRLRRSSCRPRSISDWMPNATKPSAHKVPCLHQLRDGTGKEVSKRIQQGVGRGSEIRTRTRRSRAPDLGSGTSQRQGRTRGQGGTRRQGKIEMSGHGPPDFRSHRSALHGPPPAAAMYRKTKQYNAASSPRLTIGQKFAGA